MTASDAGFDQPDGFPLGPVARTVSSTVLPIQSRAGIRPVIGPGLFTGSAIILPSAASSATRSSMERTLVNVRFSVVLVGNVNSNSILSPYSQARKSLMVTGISRVGGMGGPT